MEGLLAQDEDGEKRLKEALERQNQWMARQVRIDDTKEDPAQGGEGAASEKMEDSSGAQSGQQVEREGKVRSAAEETIQNPGTSSSSSSGSKDIAVNPDEEMAEDVQLEETEVRDRDVRIRTPERAPATKRTVSHAEEDVDMGEEHKHRRLNLDEEMSSIDKRILALSIHGVDVSEIFSPERVATTAAKSGLRAGSSFDLTNGWDCWRQ